jgi:ribonucleoside-diphosphate reductase alpha chain
MKYAYTHGLYCAKNTSCENNEPHMLLYGQDRELLKYTTYQSYVEDDKKYCVDVTLPLDIEEKHFVPINYSLSTKVAWLSGYLDGDGQTLFSELDYRHAEVVLYVGNKNKLFLQNVLLLLQTLGVMGTIKNETDMYYLELDVKNVADLCDLGLKTHNLDLYNLKYISVSKYFNNNVTVVGLEDNDEYEDTYCFNEPLEHKGIFNGVLSGNCSEIIQYTSPNEVSVCNIH